MVGCSSKQILKDMIIKDVESLPISYLNPEESSKSYEQLSNPNQI